MATESASPDETDPQERQLPSTLVPAPSDFDSRHGFGALPAVAGAELHTQSKGWPNQILSVLSNGFVLLVLGSVVTAILVPHFQRKYETRRATRESRLECLSQFLLYTNFRWQEYYSIVPLASRAALSGAEYEAYLREWTAVKVKQYDAFSKVQAQALSFREQPQKKDNTEIDLEQYAIDVNNVSGKITSWVRNLYCAPDRCIGTSDAPVDVNFDPFREFEQIREAVRSMEAEDRRLAELLFTRIERE